MSELRRPPSAQAANRRPDEPGRVSSPHEAAHKEIDGHLVSIYRFICGVFVVQAVTICALIVVWHR